MANTKALLPDTLKINLVIGLIIAPTISTTLIDTIRLAPIIKGSSDGIKIFIQIFIPFLADKMESLGKIIIPIINY